MYMRNRKYDSYKLNSFPVNYAGQYSPEEIRSDGYEPEAHEPHERPGESLAQPSPAHPPHNPAPPSHNAHNPHNSHEEK